MTYTSVLPAYSPLKAIDLPSGEKCGFDVSPWKLVRRRAMPPARSTIQMLFAYANAICVALTVGERSRRVPAPLADSGARAAGAINDRAKTATTRRRSDISILL